MATRMQQRRGTAAQWTSTNSGNGPILNAGEIGWESDTNKLKIGDGTNHWVNLDYFIDSNSIANPSFGTSITFEGSTSDAYETTLQVTDPTADRTITLPNVTGTVITTGNLSDITDIGVFTSTIVMEGSTADAHELTLSAGDPTADRTITFPDATGTVQLRVTDVSDTEIGYLNGVTSAIQTQLDDKSTASKTETFTNKSISLGSNTVTSTLAQLNTAVSDADLASLAGSETLTNKTLTSPKINEDVAVTATATELNYVDGVTSAIQIQLDAKAPLAGPTFTGTVVLPSTTSIGDVSSTEIGYVNGVTSAIQTQMDAKAPLAAPAFTGTATAVNLTISGDLTVNGTTTNINSTSLVVEDKNIVLGDVETPTDTTADGGGITLKGATDKTFNWVDATDAWTSSEHINLASGKTLKYNGTDLVASQTGNSGKFLTTDGTSSSWATVSGYSAPTLGSTSIASGATVSNLAGITINSTTIPTSKTLVATDSTAFVVPSQTGHSGKYLTTDGTTSSWGTSTSYSAPTLGSTSIASGATVTTIAGLTLTAPTLTGTVTASGDINLSATNGPGSLIDELALLMMGAL